MISKNKKRVMISLDKKLIMQVSAYLVRVQGISLSDYVAILIKQDLQGVVPCYELYDCSECLYFEKCDKEDK